MRGEEEMEAPVDVRRSIPLSVSEKNIASAYGHGGGNSIIIPALFVGGARVVGRGIRYGSR